MPLLLLKRLKKLLQENNKLTFTFTILYKADCNNLPLFLSILKTISIMKKIMILLLFVTATTTAFGQSAKFGIKGGLNFGSTGDLNTSSLFDTNSSMEGVTNTFNSQNKVGYHIGILTKFEVFGIFIQPELVYTKINTDYENNSDLEYSLSKFDIPILLGFDIIGPLNVKAGPSFQAIVNNELDGFDSIDIENPENTFTVGYQLGVGLQLGRLGLDLRYEDSFQDNTAISDTNIQDFGFVADSRPTQWILSVSYMFGDN